jgi:hypothetical protein
MSASLCRNNWVRIIVLAAACSFGAAGFHDAWASPGKDRKEKKRSAVWAVYFSSSNCPRCDAVKGLIDSLKHQYRLRVRTYDVGDEKGYALFSAMEAIHGADRFSVPLIIVGESILIGEKDIEERLEQIVRKLTASSGASLPYMGEIARTGMQSKPGCATCGKGKSPSSGKEQRRLKVLIDNGN